ncbi:MAG TPA: SagB/ThcOx family dehydrogenase [Prolixibacteraceae bacterium]|nr:SagB/ThcOx family dehydrogenase [Prolixibacteraceae bacterium]
MKKLITALCFFLLTTALFSQTSTTIVLNQPDLNKGLNVMKAFAQRSSQSAFDTVSLKLQDLSDLLWAADGVNRADIGKRTAPSAMNSQDVDVYVSMKSGMYLYDAKKHQLDLVASGDHRTLVAGRQQNFATAPVFLILVSDISRFKSGTDSLKLQWAAMDAGIVSQNIALFCSGTGLATHPRVTMDVPKLKEVMKLKDSQYLLLNNLVAYKKE